MLLRVVFPLFGNLCWFFWKNSGLAIFWVTDGLLKPFNTSLYYMWTISNFYIEDDKLWQFFFYYFNIYSFFLVFKSFYSLDFTPTCKSCQLTDAFYLQSAVNVVCCGGLAQNSDAFLVGVEQLKMIPTMARENVRLCGPFFG